MLNLKFKQNRYHFDPLENLAHNLKLRRIIENGIVAIFKQWKKLTAATSFDHELQKLSYKKAAEYALKMPRIFRIKANSINTSNLKFLVERILNTYMLNLVYLKANQSITLRTVIMN